MNRDKCSEMNANRVMQKDIMKNARLSFLVSDTFPSLFLSLSPRLGGARDILLTFRKCQYELCLWVHVCVCLGMCVCVCASEERTVSLSVVIYMDHFTSLIVKDYCWKYASDCASRFFAFSLNLSNRTTVIYSVCAIHRLLPKLCIVASLAGKKYQMW